MVWCSIVDFEQLNVGWVVDALPIIQPSGEHRAQYIDIQFKFLDLFISME